MDESEQFNPQMLTLGRNTRGLSQAQTADAANVPRSLISKYESGATYPRDSHVDQLGAALDYPVSFFRQGLVVNGPGIGEFFHRKRANTGATTVRKAHAIAETRRFDVMRLLEAWPSTEPTVPVLDVDEYEDDPAMIARLLRSVWNLPQGPIFNLTEAMERNGCVIYAHDFGTRQIDGFSVRLANLPPLFHINSQLPPDRWRWTLAHELGHVVMHGFGHVTPETAENQANLFAGEFLAPAAEIQPMLWNLDFRRLAGLKREWKISMQALINRARHLEAITERQRRELYMRLSRAGYRKREPVSLDPSIEPETKTRRLVRYHLDTLEYSYEELLEYLRIGKQDFDRYYGSTGDDQLDAALRGEARPMDLGINVDVGPIAPRLYMQLGCAEAEVSEYQESLDALYFRRNADLLDETTYQDGIRAVMNRLGLKLQALRDSRKPFGSEGSLNLAFGPNAPPLHIQLGCHPEDVANFQSELDAMYQRTGDGAWQRNADEGRRQQIVAALERKINAIREHNRRLSEMWDA